MLMTSILMIQLEINLTLSINSILSINAVNSSHQTQKNKDSIKKAQNSLNSTLKHLNELYQVIYNKISQDEDRITTIVEIFFNVLEEIEEKVNEILYFIIQ